MIKMDYQSPRWTAEILDCSMPMTFDTYSSCAFNCQYCFAFYQKSHNVKGYQTQNVRCVNPAKIAMMFNNILKGNFSALSKGERQFAPYVMRRKVMQWGAMADQFDFWEKKYGVTLALLKFFDSIDYPLSFSTKGAWWTEDQRYMRIFARHKHNWHVKISIITADKRKANVVEAGCQTPAERMAALKRLSDIGINTTLRLRPYMIGLSDDWPILLEQAATSGVKSVTTEFFCLEARADEDMMKRYDAMSDIVGYNIYDFYMANSKQHGYKRLSKEIKLPIIKAMSEKAHDLGLRFNVSDAHCREFNDFTNCCGVPPSWNSQVSHFGNAILLAKKNGHVKYSDIKNAVVALFPFGWVEAQGFNTGSNKAWAKFYDTKMHEWIRFCWNSPDAGNSPERMYSCLRSSGKDASGDVVYEYIGENV